MIGQCQVTERNGDYIVENYMQLPNEGWPKWRPLINFGEGQGDAIEFRDIDCRDLPFERLVLMMKNYDGIPRTRLKTGAYRRKR